METAITKSEVEEFLCEYGISQTINDVGIYQNAFIHKSLCRKNQENEIEGLHTPIISNERLEFLGMLYLVPQWLVMYMKDLKMYMKVFLPESEHDW